jgi:hypothetical protein
VYGARPRPWGRAFVRVGGDGEGRSVTASALMAIIVGTNSSSPRLAEFIRSRKALAKRYETGDHIACGGRPHPHWAREERAKLTELVHQAVDHRKRRVKRFTVRWDKLSTKPRGTAVSHAARVRRTPTARPAARRPSARRTSSARDPGGSDGSGSSEGDGESDRPAARFRRWLDNRRAPWAVREAPLGLWRFRAEFVRLAARWKGLP